VEARCAGQSERIVESETETSSGRCDPVRRSSPVNGRYESRGGMSGCENVQPVATGYDDGDCLRSATSDGLSLTEENVGRMSRARMQSVRLQLEEPMAERR